MKGAWPDDAIHSDGAGNWGGEKAVKVRRKRRASASHTNVDLDKVEPIRDDQACACAEIVCGMADDSTEANMMLDMLGIRRQVRGEPDPDRYLAHCFADLRTPRREDGSVA